MFKNLIALLFNQKQAPEATGKIPLDGSPRTRLTNMRVSKQIAAVPVKRGSRVDVYAKVRAQKVPSQESRQITKAAQNRWSAPAEQYCNRELQKHAMRPLYEAMDLTPQGGKSYLAQIPRQ
jgi:hypothetical protein